MNAIVTEIQIGGGKIVSNLDEATCEYIKMVTEATHGKEGYRAKINFAIKLPNGKVKHITIRDEDNETVAYGDFEGLPSALDYAKSVVEPQ